MYYNYIRAVRCAAQIDNRDTILREPNTLTVFTMQLIESNIIIRYF